MFRESSSTAADMLVLLRAVGSTLAGVVPYPQGWKRGRSQAGSPWASDPSTYCSSTPRVQLPADSRWHTIFHGLATPIREISASIKYLLFANGHPGEKSKPRRHRGHTDEALLVENPAWIWQLTAKIYPDCPVLLPDYRWGGIGEKQSAFCLSVVN